MIAMLRRLGDALGLPPKPDDAPDEALEKLQQASRLAKDYRQWSERRTGNPVQDMVQGTYRPQRRRAGP